MSGVEGTQDPKDNVPKGFGDNVPKGSGDNVPKGSGSDWIDFPLSSEAAQPDMGQRTRSGDGSRLTRAPRLVGNPGITPVSIEQYRRLAAVLHQAQVDRGIKSVMVASAFSGEGKTLTAANLALTLSESFRRRVLLVDADLRRPMLHHIFQIPNLEGLSDGLRSKTLRKMPLVEISSNLSLLPGGRPDSDPVGGLTSDRMKHVMQQAGERFDWVILDTPPIVLLPDGSLLAAMVDTSLLVVAAGRTPYAAIQRAVNAIGRERIIGILLNFVDHTGIAPALQAYDYKRRPYPVANRAIEGRT
jgi:capsular exopolysaccharide synthesis family protein